MASLHKKHDGEKTQRLDSQTGALVYGAHKTIVAVVPLSNQGRLPLVPSRREGGLKEGSFCVVQLEEKTEEAAGLPCAGKLRMSPLFFPLDRLSATGVCTGHIFIAVFCLLLR